MPIRWFAAVTLAGVGLLLASSAGEAKETPMTVAPLLRAFSTAWPAGRVDYRTSTDDSWKAYARVLRDVVKLSVAHAAAAEAALVKGLAHENRQVRALSARALGYVGRASSAGALAKVLASDPWPTVRLLAADSLGLLATPEARKALKAAQASEHKGDVLLHVAIALQRVGAPGPGPRTALLSLTEADLGAAAVGKPAPVLRLDTPEGKTVTLRSYRGKSAVVLVFLYGDG